MKNMFNASPLSVSLIQGFAYLGSVIGFLYFNYDLYSLLTVFVGYFLYSGIGFMTLHRYWTHKSFEFKNNITKWIFSFFALLLGRGSIIGWVYVHREHHAFSDTIKDPHYVNLTYKSIFFPKISHCGNNINKKLIKDLLNKPQLLINDYYNLIILITLFFLLIIDPWILYFGWCVPVMISNVMINASVYINHKYGYINHQCTDDSKNFFIFGYLLWGEGWHNNHHKHAKNWNFKEKWWEIDIMASIIKYIKA